MHNEETKFSISYSSLSHQELKFLAADIKFAGTFLISVRSLLIVLSNVLLVESFLNKLLKCVAE